MKASFRNGCWFRCVGCCYGSGIDEPPQGSIFLYRNKPPQGSIFTPVAQVLVTAVTKRKQVCPSNANAQKMLDERHKKQVEQVTTSEDNNLSYSYIWVHYHLQYHFSTASNILCPTRKCHGYQDLKTFQNPSSFPPIHPLHHAYLSCPPLRDCLGTICKKNHRKILRHLSSAKGWNWAFYLHFFHGLSCLSREEEENLCSSFQSNTLHTLDCSPVSHIWPLRDVHCHRSHRVLLQVVLPSPRDANAILSKF